MEQADRWDGEYHVDLVHTEWAAGTQSLLIRLSLRGDHIELDRPDPADWSSRVLLRYSLPDGSTADPLVHPARFLNGLHTHLSGDYLVASEPHLASDCPFAADGILPMAPIDTSSNIATGERALPHGRPRSHEFHPS
jgi:hypothetical protein